MGDSLQEIAYRIVSDRSKKCLVTSGFAAWLPPVWQPAPCLLMHACCWRRPRLVPLPSAAMRVTTLISITIYKTARRALVNVQVRTSNNFRAPSSSPRCIAVSAADFKRRALEESRSPLVEQERAAWCQMYRVQQGIVAICSVSDMRKLMSSPPV